MKTLLIALFFTTLISAKVEITPVVTQVLALRAQSIAQNSMNNESKLTFVNKTMRESALSASANSNMTVFKSSLMKDMQKVVVTHLTSKAKSIYSSLDLFSSLEEKTETYDAARYQSLFTKTQANTEMKNGKNYKFKFKYAKNGSLLNGKVGVTYNWISSSKSWVVVADSVSGIIQVEHSSPFLGMTTNMMVDTKNKISSISMTKSLDQVVVNVSRSIAGSNETKLSASFSTAF
jgi:hypothetical protein